MTNKRNILIIGITGSGKSTLANALVNKVDEKGKLKEIFKESAGGTSETGSSQKSSFEWKGANYYVIDNIGFGDNRSKLLEEIILYEIGKGIYSAKEGISQVLFVFKGRFSPEQIRNFNIFKELIFESGITKFTTLVRTSFVNFRNSQKCKEDQRALLSENSEIREIVESCNDIIHVDNPSIKEDSNNKERIIISKKDREDSREKVLKHLENCQEVYKLKEWDSIYSIVANYIEKKEKSNSLIKKMKLKKAKKTAIDEIKVKLEAELSKFRELSAAIEQNTQK